MALEDSGSYKNSISPTFYPEMELKIEFQKFIFSDTSADVRLENSSLIQKIK